MSGEIKLKLGLFIKSFYAPTFIQNHHHKIPKVFTYAFKTCWLCSRTIVKLFTSLHFKSSLTEVIVDTELDKMFLDRAPAKSSNHQDDVTKTRDFDGVRTPHGHGDEDTTATDKRPADGPDTSDTALQLTDRTVIHVNLLILLSVCEFSINS